MIGVSQTTGYAIQALSCLTDSACECCQAADLAQCSGVPKAYLAKILNSLALGKGAFILGQTTRVPRGGQCDWRKTILPTQPSQDQALAE